MTATDPERGKTPVCLSIAGSDSGGGAGIQADLKAFARCGVHGTTAIVALTAQNTVGVEMVTQVPSDMVIAQVRAVATDIGVDAVKIGMLGSVPTIEAVVTALDMVAGAPVVIDPVMVAESGSILLDPDARGALVNELFPAATVVTPNLPEARALTGLGEDADGEELARAVHALGSKAVIVTGGHSESGDDILYDGERFVHISGPRHPDGAAHGSGCTHSSCLAAGLARGLDLESAARLARKLASEAVRNGLRDIGKGAGPVDVLPISRFTDPE